MRPKRCQPAATMAATSSGLPTSHFTASASCPPAVSRSASASSFSSERAASTRLAPAPARVSANVTPSPYDAPVTSAVFPFNENSESAVMMS